jgi:methionyl-tRNA formyltransferase
VRAAFLGTPSPAIPSLAALADVADVAVVVTRPDKPQGRSGRPSPPPVKTAAREWGFPIEQPTSSAELRAVLEPLDLDVAVVVAYGRILPADVLAVARFGFVNVHFSRLPRWRGAAPVERAILEGDPVTGVSLMRLDEGLDTGPVISVIETPISDDETGGSLTARLAHLGARLLDDSLPAYLAGSLQPADQLDAGATHASVLKKEEAQITPATPAARAERMIRAFHPRPGAWCLVEGDRLKILAAAVDGADLPPGRIEIRDGAPHLGLPGGSLLLSTVQPAGRQVQPASEWMNGRRGEPAQVDETPPGL